MQIDYVTKDFQNFISRNGEIAALAMLENLERHEGIHPAVEASLEERWHSLMRLEHPMISQPHRSHYA